VSIVYDNTRESANSAQFNRQFNLFLHSYYDLKDAFIKEQLADIDAKADSLAKLINLIPLKELKLDSTKNAAQILIESIQAELKGLKGETDIEEKRKAFQMIGEQLLVLIQTVHYDYEIIYNQYCPMAMNDNGATWLSNSSDIKNPYLPTTMLTCGEVKDTLNFTVK
jgi:Cu(I)/Ag(I) efflux system membrane fusion protein